MAKTIVAPSGDQRGTNVLAFVAAVGIQNIYGLENSDKCAGSFGQTSLTANGTRANVRLYRRDFLIKQNWDNAHKRRSALSQ